MDPSLIEKIVKFENGHPEGSYPDIGIVASNMERFPGESESRFGITLSGTEALIYHYMAESLKLIKNGAPASQIRRFPHNLGDHLLKYVLKNNTPLSLLSINVWAISDGTRIYMSRWLEFLAKALFLDNNVRSGDIYQKLRETYGDTPDLVLEEITEILERTLDITDEYRVTQRFNTLGSLGVVGLKLNGDEIQGAVGKINPLDIAKQEIAYLKRMSEFANEPCLPRVPELIEVGYADGLGALTMVYHEPAPIRNFSLEELNKLLFQIANFHKQNHEIFDQEWRDENPGVVKEFSYETSDELCIARFGPDYIENRGISKRCGGNLPEIDEIVNELIDLRNEYDAARQYLIGQIELVRAEGIINHRDIKKRNLVGRNLLWIDWERAAICHRAHELAKPLWDSEIRYLLRIDQLPQEEKRDYLLESLLLYNQHKGHRLTDVSAASLFAAGVTDNYRLALTQFLPGVIPDLCYVRTYIDYTREAIHFFKEKLGRTRDQKYHMVPDLTNLSSRSSIFL
ncbi:hypothetical protein JXB41_01160 [Candidatus Woesearchaeota archaeon]|nr:hypothetical protein [Candidatus Woesearchaeota archaeon]